MSKRTLLNVGTLALAVLLALGFVYAIGMAASNDVCQITPNVGPEWNHVWSGVDCDPALVKEEWIHYDFGDHQSVDLWVTDSGEVSVEHWYSHPGGTFTVTVTRVSDGGFLGSTTLTLAPFTATPTATAEPTTTLTPTVTVTATPEPTATLTPTVSSTALPPRATPTETPTATPESEEINCTTEVQDGELVNKKLFSFSCTQVWNEWGNVDFGDNTGVDVYFNSDGHATTDHAYKYEVGNITTYDDAALSVKEGEYVFPFEVVIDDRPFSFQLYLPLVGR